jgi:7-cyano-7-deazaguanine synthase
MTAGPQIGLLPLGPDVGRDALLLLSGGMDSAALAALTRPSRTLCIDYGQRPAVAELRAARAVTTRLRLPYDELRIDLSPIGAGLLHTDNALGTPTTDSDGVGSGPSPTRRHGILSPSPEWWPLRNQLLVSIAAAWALGQSTPEGAPIRVVYTATIASDGRRHVDGTPAFYDALHRVIVMQEGGIRVAAPAIGYTAAGLARLTGPDEALLSWTHSCHRSSIPCAACPGCYKRADVLTELGILSHGTAS